MYSNKQIVNSIIKLGHDYDPYGFDEQTCRELRRDMLSALNDGNAQWVADAFADWVDSNDRTVYTEQERRTIYNIQTALDRFNGLEQHVNSIGVLATDSIDYSGNTMCINLKDCNDLDETKRGATQQFFAQFGLDVDFAYADGNWVNLIFSKHE